MKWIDEGVFFSKLQDAFSVHCQLPVVDSSREDVWRVYFSSRNNFNQSLPFYIDIQAGNPKNIIFISQKPEFALGEKEAFDQHGIMPTEILQQEDSTYLYYIGWNTDGDKPFKNSIGLAIKNSEGTWEKQKEAVIDGHENCLYSGTLGIFKETNMLFGFYLACDGWFESDAFNDPCYQIALARSEDGITWEQKAETAIAYQSEDEGGIASARVIKHNDCYHMWYAYRAKQGFRTNLEKTYRIGYAQSLDLVTWKRRDTLMDKFNNERRSASMDNSCRDMQSYPYIVKHQKKVFMFYNGNNFGQTGIAYATLPLNELPEYIYE